MSLEYSIGLVDNFSKKFDKLESKLSSAGKNMSKIGKGMTAGLTLPIAGVAAGALKMSMDFNKSMANVGTLIPGNIDRVNELKTSVQDMAVELGKSTGDLSDGLYQVISAFGDTADSVSILEINAKAAVAGIASTADAINLTSAVTKGYGDTSAAAIQKVSDLAFQTVKLGQTTFPELAASMGRVTPLAASLGVRMDEMFGVMATGTGVTGTASEVSTQLRGILQSLMSPTKGMTELLDQMGYASGTAMLEQLGLQETINTLVNTANATNTPLQDFIGSIEGQTLALALAGPQADTFTEKLKAMTDVAGATDEAFKEQTEGVNAAGFQWEQFKQKVVVTAQKLGDQLTPALTKLFDKLQPVINAVVRAVEWFANLDGKTQAVILTVVGIVAALGPLLIIAGSITTAISVLIPVVSALGVAIMGVTWPVAAVIAGIAALIAISILIMRNWTEISAWLIKTWNKIKDVAVSVFGWVTDFFKKWGPLILSVMTGPIGLLVYLFVKNFDKIKSFVMDTLNNVLDFIKGLGTSFKSAGAGLIDMMKDGIMSAANRVMDAVRNIAQKVRNMLPFSPAKDGPLSDLDKLDFASPISDSVLKGLPEVQASMAHMLQVPEVSANPTSATGITGGGRGGDIHFHIQGEVIEGEGLRRFTEKISRELAFRIGGTR
jgi:TP901 family phage tail tape measure protein